MTSVILTGWGSFETNNTCRKQRASRPQARTTAFFGGESEGEGDSFDLPDCPDSPAMAKRSPSACICFSLHFNNGTLWGGRARALFSLEEEDREERAEAMTTLVTGTKSQQLGTCLFPVRTRLRLAELAREQNFPWSLDPVPAGMWRFPVSSP